MNETSIAIPIGKAGSLSVDPSWRRVALNRLQDEGPLWTGYIIAAAAAWMAIDSIGSDGLRRAIASAPAQPAFWLILSLYYVLAPGCEWIIFRRLWNLPLTGFGALLRKQMSNELVLGYSGEAQFYLWARQHARLKTSPFGAVKDVAVLSALAGNIATLALMLLNATVLLRLTAGPFGTAFVASVGLTVLTSLLIFAFRGKLFSMSRREIRFVLGIHSIRLAASILLVGLLWHFVLPGDDFGLLIVLATLRMMLSRLPLLPAKDIVFAGLVATLAGHDVGLVAAVTLVGSLVVLGHVAVALAGFAGELLVRVRR